MSRDRVCRGCGCTDLRACPGGCAWVFVDLCSRCAEVEATRHLGVAAPLGEGLDAEDLDDDGDGYALDVLEDLDE